MSGSRVLLLVSALVAGACDKDKGCPDREGEACPDEIRELMFMFCECDDCGTAWCCDKNSGGEEVWWLCDFYECDCIDEDGHVHYDDTAYPDCILEE